MLPQDPENVLQAAADWRAQGRKLALATVISTWGSSPRPVGSQLLVDAAGSFMGSVSGGCVEGAVMTTAREVIESGKSELLEFGVSDNKAWDVGLACGGTIRVYVEPLDWEQGMLERLGSVQAAKQSVVLITMLETGEKILATGDEQDVLARFGDDLRSAAAQATRTDRSMLLTLEQGQAFVQVLNPPLRLLIIGAVHIAQVLAGLAPRAGYQVTVIDPRRAFANSERFPGVDVLAEWPDAAMPRLNIDPRTAVVTLTHDPKVDDRALAIALNSSAFYIGSLGSKRTQAARLERLGEAGFSEEQLARIHGPAGLDIGARSPGEIAVSILAEVTQALRKGL